MHKVYIRLSDAAWEQHSKLAHGLGWIRSINTVSVPGGSSRGIGLWFDALSRITAYRDTRAAADAAAFVGTLVWTDGSLLVRRAISLPDPAAAASRLAGVALQHRMVPRSHQQWVLRETAKPVLTDAEYAWLVSGGQHRPVAYAQAVLEAIGLSYLTPDPFAAPPTALEISPDGWPTPPTRLYSLRSISVARSRQRRQAGDAVDSSLYY